MQVMTRGQGDLGGAWGQDEKSTKTLSKAHKDTVFVTVYYLPESRGNFSYSCCTTT